MSETALTDTDYQRKVQQQVEQYREQEEIHDLPPIYHYWSHKHLLPKLAAVVEEQDVASFYARYFAAALRNRSGSGRLLSLGSGDASLEIDVVKRLLALGVSNFTLECCELSPLLIERARGQLKRQNLSDYFVLSETDLNEWRAARRYDGAMAHHSLHHIVELEHVFAELRNALSPDGVFLSFDMIGRNGHQRWPEALSIIEQIWRFLPDRFKQNHQMRRLDHDFVNWDCSNEGFEGVRAEEILPLLLETFSFERFLGFGNLIEVFVGRGYGPNYSLDSESDRLLIDLLAATDDALLTQGVLKPTQMCAVMRPSSCRLERCWEKLTPEFCVRPIECQPIEIGREYTVGAAGDGNFLLGNGWSFPEANRRWSDGQQAQIKFRFAGHKSRRVKVTFKCEGYLHDRSPAQKILVKYSGQTLLETVLKAKRNGGFQFSFEPRRESGTISILFPDAKRPSEFGSTDDRLLGISLSCLRFEEVR